MSYYSCIYHGFNLTVEPVLTTTCTRQQPVIRDHFQAGGSYWQIWIYNIYRHKCDTTVFSILGAIMWAPFQISGTRVYRYSWFARVCSTVLANDQSLSSLVFNDVLPPGVSRRSQLFNVIEILTSYNSLSIISWTSEGGHTHFLWHFCSWLRPM